MRTLDTLFGPSAGEIVLRLADVPMSNRDTMKSPGAVYGKDTSLYTGNVMGGQDPNWEMAGRDKFYIYRKMRLSDPAVRSLEWMLRLPIRAADWSLNPAGEGPEDRVIADCLGWNLGLKVEGNAYKNSLGRLSQTWKESIAQALFVLTYGCMCEELIWSKDIESWRDADGDEHKLRPLARLAPRMPVTILDVDVDPDTGQIISVQQDVTNAKPMPGSKIVWYVVDPEEDIYGTALALDTPVPSPDGWTTMGDLVVGDRVFDEEGKIRHVTGTRRFSDRPCYQLDFNGGDPIVADENHLWQSHTYLARRGFRDAEVLTTREMAESVVYGKGRKQANHAIVFAEPLQYVKQSLLVDPYVLGYWLGDGHTLSACITTMDSWVVEEFERRGYPCSFRANNGGKATTYGVAGDLQRQLRGLGLIGNKHVPDEYLRGSIPQRLDLLRGLMDSDGNVGGKSGRGEFCNTLPELTAAVAEIVRSLGGRVSVHVKDRSRDRALALQPGGDTRSVKGRRDAFIASFNMLGFNPFGIPRKRHGYDALAPSRPHKYHYVRSIERVANRDTVCIEVDSPSHLYLAGRSMIPTHNSIFRPAFGPWKLKQGLMTGAAIGWDRWASGLPVIRFPKNSPNAEARANLIGRNVRTHERGWVALEAGDEWDITILNGSGSIGDPTPLLQHYDAQIAMAGLQQFSSLGTTQTGSRAVGDVLSKPYYEAAQAIADDIASARMRQIFRQWVDYNFGKQYDIPELVCTGIEADDVQTLSTILADLSSAGFSFTDAETQNDIRRRIKIRELPDNVQAAIEKLPPGVGLTGAARAPKAEGGSIAAPAEKTPPALKP